jgi:hypothetical protein
MAVDPVRNFAKCRVSGGYATGVTTVALIGGEGSKLPDPAVDGPFNVVWWDAKTYADPSDDPNREIVRVTGRSADVLTVQRGQEGTTDLDHNAGGKQYKMVLAPTKKLIDDLRSELSTIQSDLGSLGQDITDLWGAHSDQGFEISSLQAALDSLDQDAVKLSGSYEDVDPLPVSWADDGQTPPGDLSVLEPTCRAKYRDFAGSPNNDVSFEWQVPHDIDPNVVPVFKVEGWITNAVGPTNGQTVRFELRGRCIEDSGSLAASPAWPGVTVEKVFDANFYQYDRFVTGWSAALNLPGLAAGQLVSFWLTRDTADTYEQPIGVGWLKIKYARKHQVG